MSAPLSHIIIVNLIIAGSATSATDIMLCIPCYMLGADVEPGLCNHHCIVLCDHKSHAMQSSISLVEKEMLTRTCTF